jgi:hypothetical protein
MPLREVAKIVLITSIPQDVFSHGATVKPSFIIFQEVC